MRAAKRRYRNGDPVRFPFAVQVHMVAARYGQDPEAVLDWPADRFREAVQLLDVTGQL